MVLVLKHEVLEVVFQRQVLGRLVARVGRAGHHQGIVEEVVLFQIAQFDVDAQQLGGNFCALAEDHRALHGVFQFTHVTGPAVVANGLLGLGREVQVVAADASALAGEEDAGDLVDVAATLAQGRQLQGDDVQAVIQVFTELAGLGQVFQVAVGRGDQAHIDLLRLHRTYAAYLAFLQHTQQSSLGFQRQFANFIEEQRTAIGGLHQAGAPGAGAGERAFFVAEQFGFDQRFGDGRAVHRDHRCLGPARQVVQGAGHQLFTGARLALDQHIGVGWGDFADLAVHVLHGLARADDADFAIGRCRTAFVGGCNLAIAGAWLGRRCSSRGVLPVAQNTRHCLQHLVMVEGLGDVVHRAHFHRVHR